MGFEQQPQPNPWAQYSLRRSVAGAPAESIVPVAPMPQAPAPQYVPAAPAPLDLRIRQLEQADRVLEAHLMAMQAQANAPMTTVQPAHVTFERQLPPVRQQLMRGSVTA